MKFRYTYDGLYSETLLVPVEKPDHPLPQAVRRRQLARERRAGPGSRVDSQGSAVTVSCIRMWEMYGPAPRV